MRIKHSAKLNNISHKNLSLLVYVWTCMCPLYEFNTSCKMGHSGGHTPNEHE